jgi:alpha-mannosidase
MHDHFNLFEKYPHYIFNFTGSNRYRLIKEYYPADVATISCWGMRMSKTVL